MKPSQIASAVVSALLVALGVAVKFSNLFSPDISTVASVLLGVGGALSTRLLPPFLPSMLPPHVEKVLSQINGSVLAVLAVLVATPVIDSGCFQKSVVYICLNPKTTIPFSGTIINIHIQIFIFPYILEFFLKLVTII
jgi:hypothetical protein